MNFIDLTNIRHQEILIEEIIRAKRIIKQQKSKLAEAWPRKGQRAYDIKVGDRVVIKPPARKTSYRGTVVKINADGTFDWKDSKGELWSGSDIQVVSVNGAPPQEKTSDGDDNNNGYPDATENPLGDDDGMLVTKGHTALIIKPEDIAAFMAGKSVFAFGDDGKEYDIDRNMADVEWSDQEKKGPLELPNSRIVSIQADIITTRAGEKYKILTTKPNLKKPDLYVDMGFIERSGDPKKGYIQQIDPDDSYGLSTNGLQKVVSVNGAPPQEKKTYTGLEILNHPDLVNLPETRQDGLQKNLPKVLLPSLNDAGARLQIFSKADLTGSEVQGPKMVHKHRGYLEKFESMFNEVPIFIDVDHEYLGKIIDIKNPKFVERMKVLDRAQSAWNKRD